MSELWIPIVDYAVLKGISTSTLRRYIKAKKVEYKIEDGRYLLRADATDMSQARILEERLLEAQEQISELKMLVAIYEEKLAQTGH